MLFSLIFLFSKFSFALKALFLFLDCNVTMLECNVMSTLFAHYIWLHGYINFIYLFDLNTKYRDMYCIPQISQKYWEKNSCSYCPALLWRNVHLVIFCSMSPQERSQNIFSLNEFMPFEFEYNFNYDSIFVKKKKRIYFFSQFDSRTLCGCVNLLTRLTWAANSAVISNVKHLHSAMNTNDSVV